MELKSKKISFTISESEYPILFKLKDKEFKKSCEEIFKLGYLKHFPDLTEIDREEKLYKHFELLKTEIKNPEILAKFDSFENIMSKLIGISSNSTLKGDFAENMLEIIFNKRYGDITYEDKSHNPHCGDAWLHFWDDFVAMLESKNYTTSVSLDEVKKMERDMIENNILYGIFVSWNSNIISMKEFDIHTFNHNGETYTIILISNLSKDESRIDLAVQLLRKLKLSYSNPDKFPWIISDIKKELDEFEKICELNYVLRDNFNILDSNIKKSLNDYYTNLREYQMKLEEKANDIITKINNTMDTTTTKNNLNQAEVLQKFKNKKVNNVLSKFLDLVITIKWNVKINDNIDLIKDDILIGYCKIMNKKISICINKLNFTIEIKDNDIDINNKLESIKILNSLV